jgi:hypothetical protein
MTHDEFIALLTKTTIDFDSDKVSDKKANTIAHLARAFAALNRSKNDKFRLFGTT